MRVVIVEDNAEIVRSLSHFLVRAGISVVAIASTLDAGLQLTLAEFDVAILDINLGENTSEAIATRLEAAGVPFLVMSGSAAEDETALSRAPFLSKPLNFSKVLEVISLLHSGG